MNARRLLYATPFLLLGCSALDETAAEDGSVTLEEAAAVAAITDDGPLAPPDVDGERPPRLPGHFDDCRPPVVQEEVLGAYDDDGDGLLSPEERAAMAEDLGMPPPGPPPGPPPPDGEVPPPPPPGVLGVLGVLHFIYDANESHALEDEELLAMEDDFAARCEARDARLLADFDDDRDGVLSLAELEGAFTTLRAAHEAERAAREAEVDTNDDGVLSPEELAAHHEAMHAQHLASVDANGDGEIDASERAAERETLRAHVRNGDPLPMPPPPPGEGPMGPPPPPQG